MRKHIAIRGPVVAFYAAIGVAGILAEESLGPMGGVGNVMRDAERRAVSPVRPVTRETPQVQVPPSHGAGTLPSDDRVVGVIRSVDVVGDREFALRSEVDVPGRLMASLGDDRPRTVEQIKTAITKVRDELMRAGYYLLRLGLARKRAYDASTGALTVSVDRGRFGRISVDFAVDGDSQTNRVPEGTWYSREQIERRFHRISEGDTFDYGRLRGALSEVNSHPDLTVDTDIRVRGEMEGEGEDRRRVRYTDLGLTVHESCPFHALWDINNFGMREIDEWQTSLTFQYLNLTKHDDVLTVSPSTTFNGELTSYAASYMLPHQWLLGGNTTLYGGYSRMDTDDIVPQLDLEGTGWFTGLMHSENLVENDAHLLAVQAGVMARYIDDQYSVMGRTLQRRDVTVFPLSAALSYTGRRADCLGGRNFATVQGVYNLATAGDHLDEMWTDADENYWIVRAQYARLQPLFGWANEAHAGKEMHQWTLFSRAEAQIADGTLIPVEKLSLGGYNTVRGYRSRSYLGDWGLYGTEELRTPILVDSFASLFGDRTAKTPFDRLQAVCFADWGYVCYNNLPHGYDEDEWLCGAGVGFRAAMTKYCSTRCDFALPLRDTATGHDRDFEVYFSIQFQF